MPLEFGETAVLYQRSIWGTRSQAEGEYLVYSRIARPLSRMRCAAWESFPNFYKVDPWKRQQYQQRQGGLKALFFISPLCIAKQKPVERIVSIYIVLEGDWYPDGIPSGYRM